MFEADVVCQKCDKEEKLGYDYCSCPRCGAWMIARAEPMILEALEAAFKQATACVGRPPKKASIERNEEHSQ